jgi:hypothetical protein
MLNSFMVNYYWHKFVTLAALELAACKPALKHIIWLFITVKGFAITRKLRQQLKAQSEKTKEPKSSSLRGGLKKPQ